MKRIFFTVFLISICYLNEFAQQKVAQNTTNDVTLILPETKTKSNIVSSSLVDTVFLKLQLQNAHYDFKKNNLPYYLISKTTNYNQNATPTLIIKHTQLVAEPHASVIRKFMMPFLTQNYELKGLNSLSINENLNHHTLIPFRINNLNQIEELIDYDINWQINSANRMSISATSFTNNSVLANGTWYKIGLSKTGVYKLDKTFLTKLGIDINTLNPKNIRIYGNGGKMTPERNSDFRYDDLQENAIQVVGEADGVFNNSDYVLFYATGSTNWKRVTTPEGLKFRHEKNLYSDSSFYFVNVDLGAGKRIITNASLSSIPNTNTSSFDFYGYRDEDNINFIRSGRQLFGEYFDVTTSYSFDWNDGNFVTNDSLIAEVRMGCRSSNGVSFLITGNGLNKTITSAGFNINDYLGIYADIKTVIGYALNNNTSGININISKQTANATGYLDFVTVNARQNLIINNKQFQFRDTRVSSTGKICNYTLLNPINNTVTIWNVTNPLNPYNQSYVTTGTNLTFTASADSLNEYALSIPNDYYTPVFVGKVANQNLHAIAQADYVIISHPLFLQHAQRLANLHQQQEGFTYAIANTDLIYNEFGSGKPEATAIRDFIRMLYNRNLSLGKQVKYVALLGDGSYFNLNRSLTNNTNLIPTYQTLESSNILSSSTSDDFYGLMDPNEGYDALNETGTAGGIIDIGIGRLTCKSAYEMDAVTLKIENYYKKESNFSVNDENTKNCNTANQSVLGDWRNWLVFMADDEDGSLHAADADGLANNVKAQNNNYNIDKIYLDAYQQYSTPGGQRYPDVVEDLNRRINKGCLIYNYTGHGGEVGLTAERVVNLENVNGWNNFNQLTLIITATCEFTRYDDPNRTSAGEMCLLNPKGGAIAMFSTCRVAYSNTNKILNAELFNNMFKNLPNGKKPCLGDIVRQTKANLTQAIAYGNFHLIGDPALKLAYPSLNVTTSIINNNPVVPIKQDSFSVYTASRIDTLSALSKITISGSITNSRGLKQTNFNGVVYPTVFNKLQDVVCLLNDATSSINYSVPTPFQFKLQKNILYRGKAQVTNGDFSFTFIVPKDISFATGLGKISYYATNGTIDAAGSYTQLIVGGVSTNTIVDNDGPTVNLYLNDKNFANGGTTNEKPILYANLTDSSGINTVGTGIGHDINVILDQNTTKPIVLNDYYEANLNSYQSGKVRYPFNDLSEGSHRISFKVWDIQNNSNTVYSDFVVAKSAELALTHVLNYPNPFSTQTKFFLEYNQACNPLKVTVQIYTISGKVVKTLQRNVTSEGFRPEGIDWDGKDDYGDKLARGVYVYKVAILTSDSKKAEKIEKLVILN